MTQGWLDPNKYEHIPITSATGPGTMHEGYAWKWVNHSTDGPPGSIAGTISLFEAKPGYCPHFMIDPMGTGRRVQHIPWTWSGCALIGGSGGYQTNRGRAVQVEICGYARDAEFWPDSALWAVADLIADVIRDGCPINPDNTPDSSQLSGTLATTSAPQRMDWEQWRLFDGIGAHVYVPNNDHWDCGRLHSLKIAQFVKDLLGGATPPSSSSSSYVTGPAAPSSSAKDCLTKGMMGGAVRAIQQLLSVLGYDVGALDGVFGNRTHGAVRAFQINQSLEVDGVVGPVTYAKLNELAAAAGVTSAPTHFVQPTNAPAWPGTYFVYTSPIMRSSGIRTWQGRMAERGWRIAVDGRYGRQSFSVCQMFQEEKGLRVDGIVGPQTWAATWAAPVT